MGRFAGVGHDKLLSSLVSVAPSTGTIAKMRVVHAVPSGRVRNGV
jgi:hypothetical protein